MTNLVESSAYDEGIYQIETTDPVVGGPDGIDNLPHKSLANRTKYLKDHVDALEAAAGNYAPKASPALTGSPTAPTQPLGDTSTKIANDEFVQKTVGGFLSKSVAGAANVSLTPVEAGNGIIELTGAITANIAVIVPVSPTRDWIFINHTSGAFEVTIKTAAGTGVVVDQGTSINVYTDGTNVDYNTTKVTRPLGESSTRTASTEFTQKTVGGVLSKSVAGAVDVTLTAVEAGNAILSLNGVITADIALIVPGSPTRAWVVKNDTTGAFKVTVKTSAGTGVVIPSGVTMAVWTDTVNVYDANTKPQESREVSIASSATPTPPADLCDSYAITALAVAATIGAPTFATKPLYPRQALVIAIKDNGTARSLTWNAIYRAGSVALPTTTIVGKTHYIGMFYHSADNKWDIIGAQYTG
jgi:hypothetical protein